MIANCATKLHKTKCRKCAVNLSKGWSARHQTPQDCSHAGREGELPPPGRVAGDKSRQALTVFAALRGTCGSETALALSVPL